MIAVHPTSLTGKTLLQIAFGVTFIIALSSAVSYYLTYREMQQQVSEQLHRYVVQRGQGEEDIFTLARDTQYAIRRVLLDQYDKYQDAKTLARFEQMFARYPDGAVRSRKELFAGQGAVTGWIHRDTVLTEELRRRTILFYDILQQFKPTSLVRFTDIYFTAPEQINIGTDPPGVEHWAMTVAADFEQNAEEWAYSADATHNPMRETVWSTVFLDPVWKKLMITISTPIDRDDRHIGTIHNDLFLDDLIGNLLRSGIPESRVPNTASSSVTGTWSPTPIRWIRSGRRKVSIAFRTPETGSCCRCFRRSRARSPYPCPATMPTPISTTPLAALMDPAGTLPRPSQASSCARRHSAPPSGYCGRDSYRWRFWPPCSR